MSKRNKGLRDRKVMATSVRHGCGLAPSPLKKVKRAQRKKLRLAKKEIE